MTSQPEPVPAPMHRPPGSPLPNPKLFIISGRCGRLANRMVLFANFIALAQEQGHRVMNPTFHSYATLFRSTRRDIYCQYPSPARPGWLDVVPGVARFLRWTRLFFRVARAASGLNERWPIFGHGTVTLRQTQGQEITALDGPEVQAKVRDARVILVNGWNFRVPALVQRHADKIKAYFRPIEALEQVGREAVDRLRRNANVVVGVHIRRGDYLNWKAGKCFFEISRYAGWMQAMAGQFPGARVAFLICSNEPRSEAEFPGLSVGFGPGMPVADLHALGLCDYLFGPVSTFSQWASFYGTKPLFHLYDREDRLDLARFRVSDLREVP